MGLSSTDELAGMISEGVASTESLKEDILPQDIDMNFLLAPYDRLKVSLTAVGVQWNYPDDSFILDHPTYGELDSSTLKLDGGYAGSTGGMIFPGTFPLVFIAGTSTSTVLFTYTS